MQGKYLMNVYSVVNVHWGIEPHTYLPHGFASKTNPLFRKKSKKFSGNKKSPLNSISGHTYNIKMGKKIETYNFSVIGLLMSNCGL